MNRKAAIFTVIALTMATGQLAFAQGNSNRDERGGNQGRQQQRPVAAAVQHDNRGFGRAHEQERSNGRGAGPNNEYYRGDRLPAEYRHRNYVVDDWRSHNLSAPPPGHQWVQSGGDYILIAVATGIIAQLLLNR
jgi:Ni/Co efflux regulator RcnB